MGPSARLVTIKRSGADGAHFPLSLRSCWFGRGIECDIRIQLPVVSKQHCKIEINEQEAVLHNFSSANPTKVNGSAIAGPVQLRHGDLITIVDRSFRYECESPQNGSKSPKSPRKTHEQESTRRVSRAGISSDPDEKNQDSKVHSEIAEGSVSGRPPTPASRVTRASRGSEASGAQGVPGVQPPERPGRGGHAGALTSKGSERSSEGAVASFDGGLEPLPSTPGLHEGKNEESPFQELYQSLKKELDVKSRRRSALQLRRPSGSQADLMAEATSPDALQRAGQQTGSGRPRARCGRPSLGQWEPEPEGSPARPGAVGLTPTQSYALVSGVSRVKSPMQYSHKRKYEDLCAAEGREPAELVTGGGSEAAARSVSPGRLPSRTPAAAQGASSAAGTPARLSPKSRRSVPARVAVLPMETEIQNRPLAQWPARTEKMPKDSPRKPEKSDPTQTCSGLPGLSSVDISNSGDPISKNEGMSLKRRRVSFGGRLRPELFDENLPPNTPLKRGETPAKRRSLATPTVLKKIVKENPQPSGQEPSTDISVEVPTQSLLRSPAPGAPGSSAERRRSGRLSSASGGSSAPQQAGFARRAGRKSGTLPSKRTSVGRSQHDILQMICSKRRSGASEANLIVAKSWADIVKLGAKQAQTKAVRPGPPRQVNRRQKRPDTPKKPADQLPGQFSTGHANSPCTIVIGRARVAKVSAPARPYRMLNNLALNSRVMDYNEDLSGLAEMFKTPVKEEPATSTRPVALSENLLGKKSEVNVSGEKSAPPTSETLGENVISRTPIAAKWSLDEYSASPALRRKSTRGKGDVKTPGSGSKVTPVRNQAPCSETASTLKRLRRSAELGNIQVTPSESEDKQTQAGLAERVGGRTPRKTPQQEQKAAGDGESSERTTPLRRSSRSWGQKCESTEERGPSCELFQEPVNAESQATEVPCGSAQAELTRTPASRRSLKTPPEARIESAERSAQKRPKRADTLQDDASAGMGKGAPGHSLDLAAFLTSMRRLPRTPRNKSQPLEDLTGFKELFQTPEFSNESLAVGKITVGPCRTAQPELASPRTQPKTPLKQAHVDLGGALQTTREAVHTPRAPRGDGKDFETFSELAKQKMDAAAVVNGSKRGPRRPKEKAAVLEDLAGLKELFQTPDRASNPSTVEKITEIPGNLPQPELTQTPTRLKSRLGTSLGKVNIQERLELRKLTEPSEEAVFLPQEAARAEKGIKAFTETPKHKAYMTEKTRGGGRRSQTPRQKGPALEDLSGFKELFQTPGHATDTMSPQPGPVQTPARMKARRKVGLGKEDVSEEPLTPGRRTRSADKAGHTAQTPTGNVKGIKQPVETPKQELDLTESFSGLGGRPRTPKAKDQALEDLTGVRELFLTPGHTKDPKSGAEATEITFKVQQLEPANTPASTRKRRKTSPRNETSGQKMLTRLSGEAAPFPKAPLSDDKSFEVSKIHAEQKVDPASTVTDSKSQRGTREENSQPVEDLAGFKELFQTPGHARTPCNSGEFGQTPASLKGSRKRSLRKVQGELPALQPTRSSDRAPRTPLQTYGVQDVREFTHTPKQKLQPVENLSGRRGRSWTPEVEQSLEDLTGFRELFLTPGHPEGPKSGGENLQTPCQSPRAEPENVSASMRAPPKTPAATVGLEEHSALTLTHASRETVLTREEEEDEDKTIKAFKKSAKQKAEPSTRVTGSRRSKAPREETQHLEDLTGFKELFQTPDHTESMSDGKSTRTSCKLPALESTPASREAWSETPGRELVPTDTLKTSEGDMDVKTSKRSSKQRLDLAGSVASSRRWPRTPKEKGQPEEDLAGLRELFQTPTHTEESVSDGKTTGISCASEQRAPASKGHLKTDLTNVNVPDESSVQTNGTQMSREAAYTPKVLGVPEGCEKEVKKLKGSAKRKLDSPTSAAGGKRQRETPKDKSQPLEDLDGFKELFQTPVHTEKPTGDVKATETTDLSNAPGADSMDTQTRTRRQLRTAVKKADVKEEVSTRTRRKLPQPSGEPAPVPGTADEDVRALEESEEQKLDIAENVIGNKRQPRTRKAKIQPAAEPDGLKELHTADHTQASTTNEKTTDLSNAPGADSMDTQTRTRRQLRTAVKKADVKEEVSTRTRRKLPQPSGEPAPVPGTADEDVRALEESEEQKLESAAGVIGNKRQPRTRKAKIQPAAEPDGLKELHAADHTQASTTNEKTTDLSNAPGADSMDTQTRTRRQLRTAVKKADVKEEVSTRTRRKLPQPSGEPAPVPGTADEDVRALEESEEQKLDIAENVIGNKRQPRTRKAKIQPAAEPDGLKELHATDHTQASTTNEKTTDLSNAPGADSMDTQTRTRRQLRTAVKKADVKEEISTRTRRKLPQPSGEPAPVPGTADEDVRALEESEEQKLDIAENVIGNKRQPRTRKAKTQPLEHQDSLKGLSPTPGHMEELNVGVHTFKDIPEATPDRATSPKMLQRILRASRVKAVEDPAELQSTSSRPLAPQSGCGEDGSLPGAKKSCSVELVAKRPANKRQRSACSEQDQSPQPEKTAKRPRTSAKKMAENLNTQNKAAKQEVEEAPITPNKEMPSRRRCRNKTDVEERQTLRFLLPAENIKMQKNEVFEQQELQKPDEGAEKLRSRGTRVRFGKENTAAVKESGTRGDASVKTERGLQAAAPGEPRVRPGADSQRATRAGGRRAHDPDKDRPSVHQENEDQKASRRRAAVKPKRGNTSSQFTEYLV
ncbi:proliferation marker protein Ki-67 isoform X2 [Ochotona curzoniae]|uniref:proliferation marker protein Ki-67 isoform X2 n=1 Tax=Ochotona curzoniae TaxID=130825 RepID=UPI001B34B184|nr:proliferation marker protein Ki-67 isoform X2 [Ochotona curzoniae]